MIFIGGHFADKNTIPKELTERFRGSKVEHMPEITAEAPNFGHGDSGGTYPGGGERIGVAWRAAWAILRDGFEHSADELSEAMRAAVEIQDKTARNLLRQARAAGVLKVRHEPRRFGERFSRSQYRIAR